MKLLSKHKLNLEFENLTKSDFSDSSVSEILKAVQDAFGILPTVGNQITREFAVIRARKIDAYKEDITDPNTFGSPLSLHARKGRANLIGAPVFYGATDSRTAMREIHAVDGFEYYVSIWEKSADVPMLVALYTLHAEKNHDLSQWVKDAANYVMNGLQIPQKDRPMFFHAMRLRSKLFTDSSYDISSKLAHGLLYDPTQAADAIIYPSVQEAGRVCFAIHPEFVQSNFVNIRCYRMVFSPGWIFRVMGRGSCRNKRMEWEETGAYELDDIDRKYIG